MSDSAMQPAFSAEITASGRNAQKAESVKIEQSILKTYRKRIWNPFIGALKDYAMIQEGDRIAVCISGGKDSMLLAKCMQHLQKYSPVSFHVEYLVMDPAIQRKPAADSGKCRKAWDSHCNSGKANF